MNHKVLFVSKSGTSKLGSIASSYTAPSTCPVSCPLLGRECFGRGIRVKTQWARVAGTGCQKNILDWAEYCYRVASLPKRSLVRQCVAGDQPKEFGSETRIDAEALDAIALACRKSEAIAWTFTHHDPTIPHNSEAIARANRTGLTVNLSADDLEEADSFASLGVAPVCVTVPSDFPASGRTKKGHALQGCPAQTKGLTCEQCGNGRPFCARADRTFIVTFRAHGQGRKRLDARLSNPVN
jgi:hypothetical protein